MTRVDCRKRQGDRTICDICLALHAVKHGSSELSSDYNEGHVAEDIQLLKDILKTWTPSPSFAASFDESVRFMILSVLMEYGELGL